MRAVDLFEHQVVNADTVAAYCTEHASEVIDPARRAWMEKAARRYISNENMEIFLCLYTAKDYLEKIHEREFIDSLVSDEMRPYLQHFLDTNTPFAVFVPADQEDNPDMEDAVDKLAREMSDVKVWLNTMPAEWTSYRNMNFATALRFAEAHAKKMARMPNRTDVKPILKIGDFTWVQLLSRHAVTAEGHLMQNCLKDQPRYGWNVELGSADVYSLRDRKGNPHVTVYACDGVVEQAKGKQNDVPKPIYQKAANLLFKYLDLEVESWETKDWVDKSKPELAENYVQVKGRYADDVNINVKVWIDPSHKKLRTILEKSRWGVLKGIIARWEDKPVVLVWDAQDAFHDAVMSLGKIKHEIKPDRQGGGGFVIAKNEEIMKSDEDWGYYPEMHKVDVAQDRICVMSFAARDLTQYPAFATMMGPLEPSPKFKRKMVKEAVLFGEFPTRTFKKLWHVGSMNAGDKRQDSYEGAGLSVSLHPAAWRRIARGHVGGDTWEMTKSGNRFLDYHKIGKRRWGVIRQWATENGWAEAKTQYEVSWYDDEMEQRVGFVFDTRKEAEAESDPEYNEDIRIKEIPTGLTGTQQLATRCHQRGPTSSPQELLASVYAEDVLGLDGVWWQDVFDPSNLSAPRGVIVPSKVSTWAYTKIGYDHDDEEFD